MTYNGDHLQHKCEPDGCFITRYSGSSWNDIAACFPRNIEPTDIDGMVEINGHFLFLEEKGEKVGFTREGQRRALLELSRQPQTTVLIFRPGGTRGWQVLKLENGQGTGFRDCSRSQLLHWIQRWARDANTAGRNAS